MAEEWPRTLALCPQAGAALTGHALVFSVFIKKGLPVASAAKCCQMKGTWLKSEHKRPLSNLNNIKIFQNIVIVGPVFSEVGLLIVGTS